MLARSPGTSGTGGAALAAQASAARPRGGGRGGGNAFSGFVKERFAATKAALPKGTPHKDVMGRLAAAWREEKAARAAAAAAATAATASAAGQGGSAGSASGEEVAEEEAEGLPSLIRRLQL
jgi:hypothetical protein